VEFRLLGPLEVLVDGAPIPLGGARQRAVLGLLLTRANEVVSVDRLIDDLWGAEAPRTAANTVRYYVSQLRKLLGAERIVTRPPGYAICVSASELDLERFAQPEITRLEELRLAVLEERIDADLALGRHAQLVGEQHVS
jgi:DNA-binding SARP family transcriptional activator